MEKQMEKGRKSLNIMQWNKLHLEQSATKCQSETLWPCLRNALYPLPNSVSFYLDKQIT